LFRSGYLLHQQNEVAFTVGATRRFLPSPEQEVGAVAPSPRSSLIMGCQRQNPLARSGGFSDIDDAAGVRRMVLDYRFMDGTALSLP
jgi:hypothetical protein